MRLAERSAITFLLAFEIFHFSLKTAMSVQLEGAWLAVVTQKL
jgi:hypothetical protein